MKRTIPILFILILLAIPVFASESLEYKDIIYLLDGNTIESNNYYPIPGKLVINLPKSIFITSAVKKIIRQETINGHIAEKEIVVDIPIYTISDKNISNNSIQLKKLLKEEVYPLELKKLISESIVNPDYNFKGWVHFTFEGKIPLNDRKDALIIFVNDLINVDKFSLKEEEFDKSYFNQNFKNIDAVGLRQYKVLYNGDESGNLDILTLYMKDLEIIYMVKNHFWGD